MLLSLPLVIAAVSAVAAGGGQSHQTAEAPGGLIHQVGIISPSQLQAAMLQAVADKKDEHCLSDMRNWIDAITAGERWALEMADSWSKSMTGILHGNTYDFGNYQECIDSSSGSSSSNNSDRQILGAYVLPVLDISCSVGRIQEQCRGADLLPLSLRMAVCVPDSCDSWLLSAALQSVASNLVRTDGWRVNVSLPYGPTSRLTAPRAGLGHWIVLAIFVALVACSLTATAMDVFLNAFEPKTGDEVAHTKPTGYMGTPQRMKSLLRFFSLRIGLKRLMGPPLHGNVQCLAGMRFLSIAWIILGNCEGNMRPVINRMDVVKMEQGYPFMIVYNFFLAVDTYFAINGLVCYRTFMKEVRRTGNFNWWNHCLCGLVRMTPVLAVVLAYHCTWFDVVRSGPSWSVFGADNVLTWFREYWWTNILYISNYFFLPEGGVAPHTWYVSCLMQLYVLAPLVLIPLWKRPLLGKVWLGFVTLGACIVPGVVSIVYRASNPFGKEFEVLEGFKVRNALYFPTYTRAAPYLGGIAAGYVLDMWKGSAASLRSMKVQAVMLWSASAFLALAAIFSAYPSVDIQHHEYNQAESFFYIGLSRLAWAVGVLLVVIACETKCAGPVNSFLSCGAFTVLGRLAFSIYLLQMIIILMNSSFLVHTVYYFSAYYLVLDAVSVISICTPAAAVLYLIVEQPSIFIEESLRESAAIRDKENSSNAQEIAASKI